MPDPMIEFPPGTVVKLTKLRTRGVVIRKVNKHDYLVRVGSTEIRVAQRDLTAATGSPQSSPANKAPPSDTRRKSIDRLKQVDLHGLNRDEAIGAVEQAINGAIMQGYRGLQVIHGIGSGKLRSAIYNYCSESEVIAEIRPDPSNPGVARLYFFTV